MSAPRVWKAHSSYILGLLYAPDGQLVSCGGDGAIAVWAPQSGQAIHRWQAHEQSANGIALSPDGSLLASVSSDRTAGIWAYPDGDLVATMQDRKRVTACLTWAPEGDRLIVGSYGGRVAIWTRDGEPVNGFAASQRNLSTVALSPEGSTLITGGQGDDVFIWSFPTGEPLTTLSAHRDAVMGSRFLDEGATLATLGYRGKLALWRRADWILVREHTLAEGARAVAWSPDESLAAVLAKGRILLRDVATWRLEQEWPSITPVVNAAAFAPDLCHLAVGGADGRIALYPLGD